MDIRIANIVASLERVADSCEQRGLMKEAYDLDVIANTLEREAGMMGFLKGLPAKAKQLAQSMGITLNAQNAADIVKKYYDPNVEMEKEAAMKDKARQMAMLAAMLVTGFLSQVEAAKGPITVQFPTGSKTYSAQELKQLAKGDPKSFAVVMEQYQEQQAKGQQVRQERERSQERAQKAEKPEAGAKVVKDRERLSDDFGNTAVLITYQDGTKELKDDILQGGVSLRKMLEDKGEIAKGGGEYAKK
jgi:hypothetical protein